MDLLVIKDQERRVALSELHQITGARYAPYLEFIRFSDLPFFHRRTARLLRQKKIPESQIWLGTYFQKEILAGLFPPVSLRWIDDQIGWGVFAEKDFSEMEYIAEYTGVVRKRIRADKTNPYCFEYLFAHGEPSGYLIDGRDQGGISRYMNHSSKPNLMSGLAICNQIPHVILVANRKILKGEELRHNYGSDYWKNRPTPQD